MKGLKKRLTKNDSLMIVWQENEGTHAILTQPPIYNIDYVFRLLRYQHHDELTLQSQPRRNVEHT